MSDSDFEDQPPKRDKGKRRATSPEPSSALEQERERRSDKQLALIFIRPFNAHRKAITLLELDLLPAAKERLRVLCCFLILAGVLSVNLQVQLKLGSFLTTSTKEGRAATSLVSRNDRKKVRLNSVHSHQNPLSEPSIEIGVAIKHTDERQIQQCICGTSDPDALLDCGTSPADSDHILHQIYTNKALAQARNAAKWSRNILHPIYDSRDYSEFAKNNWAKTHGIEMILDKALKMTDLVRTIGKQFLSYAYLRFAEEPQKFGGMLNVQSGIYDILYLNIASQPPQGFSGNHELRLAWLLFS
ncbi:hypothetical protein HDV05_003548 [Chytridiales sp. JEL 0842]|nr:hypothetical protein HDV05_003548 [Chytridiales sp. JEL 0842]